MKRTSKIWTVMKKELNRFFGDRRMVVSTILLPGVLIYVMYTFMGSALTDMFTVDEDYRSSLRAVNMPASVSAMISEADMFEVTAISGSDEISEAKNDITEKELDILMVFPENFDEAVADYASSGMGDKMDMEYVYASTYPESDAESSDEPVSLYAPSGEGAAPRVEIYYNSTRTESSAAHSVLVTMLDTYESALANIFDVNPGEEGFDLASEKDASGFMFSSLLPMLMMLFLFTGCMGVAPEAIAGEKERGTIATMLITPMKRSELAIGKIISLALIALLSGASSAIGTMLSLPNLTGGASDSVSAVFYSITDYLMLAAVVLSTVLLFISLISIISAYAKTIKEAGTTVTPLMVVVMLVGITGMFSSGAKDAAFYYLVPVYNSVQSMVAIFSFSVVPLNILVTVLSNLVLSVICGFVLTRMFNSEKCMFNK